MSASDELAHAINNQRLGGTTTALMVAAHYQHKAGREAVLVVSDHAEVSRIERAHGRPRQAVVNVARLADRLRAHGRPLPAVVNVARLADRLRGHQHVAVLFDKEAVTAAMHMVREEADAERDDLLEQLAVLTETVTTLGRELEEARGERDEARAEAQTLREREDHYAKVLNVCDGGQYRNDWDAPIARTVKVRDEARAWRREALPWLRGYHAHIAEHYPLLWDDKTEAEMVALIARGEEVDHE
jgi:hypothetical protein